ncbi:prepilin-type N-terminal cleavage/methylation domain-containing protein [Anaeromyxobacter sp. PSR-1]|uniref:prepilin-type N-terminal cleavage/methylation domain-containing protein n=1 Tax=Anaeromyxobacter sp. PSR-1 TaxID=1300915 RepID=UPI0005E83378|nr:prepilin-type N-terminal cleavage/methylation domain-containing protein [Anaeromyxobacter sp. PSR-1]GAO02297.1 hypothetical protein PSR1_01168 [Anaeromyxobacter sp. PSR-1]
MIRSRLGFTLVEIMIATGVVSIVLAAVIAASSSQQRAFFGGQRQRATQGNARTALLYLEQKLPLAGWGLDGSLALDFQFYAPAFCPANTTCPPGRDSIADADELVFYARNPSYWVPPEGHAGALRGNAWTFVALPDASHATLEARAGDDFLRGQILQVVCPGELRYAYFTVKSRAAVTSAGNVDVELEDVVLTDPFRRQDVAATMGGCRAFQVDRYRFHVRPVARADGTFDPYLVLDRGLDTTGAADGAPDGVVDEKDEVIVAEGVEAFQVAYVFANPAIAPAGATAGTAIAFGEANDDQSVLTDGAIIPTKFSGSATSTTRAVYTPSSFYSYRYSDPIRQTRHQANIRAVRLALVARSPQPDPSARATFVVDSSFALLNQSGAPDWVTGAPKIASGTDGFQRTRVEAVVNLPNMTVRSITGF